MLGADVCHRSALIELESGALGTGFSPCEFARLATEVDRAELPAEPATRRVRRWGRWVKGGESRRLPDTDRIPDPVGRTQQRRPC